MKKGEKGGKSGKKVEKGGKKGEKMSRSFYLDGWSVPRRALGNATY